MGFSGLICLIVVDQHASDEEFSFGDQQRNTTVKSQRLLVQVLELGKLC